MAKSQWMPSQSEGTAGTGDPHQWNCCQAETEHRNLPSKSVQINHIRAALCVLIWHKVNPEPYFSNVVI